MSVRVRRAGEEDVPAIAALARELRLHQGDSPDQITTETLLHDGFGSDPQFRAMVAELDGAIVGYALFHDSYEPAHAARGVYLCDLFVGSHARRRGVGTALVAAVAQDARSRRRSFVWWVSRRWNSEAHAFYATLAAFEEPVMAHAVAFASFDRLSRAARDPADEAG